MALKNKIKYTSVSVPSITIDVFLKNSECIVLLSLKLLIRKH